MKITYFENMFPFSISFLLWTIYYLAKKNTLSVITTLDKQVCYSVGLICIIIIIYNVIIKVKRKIKNKKIDER